MRAIVLILWLLLGVLYWWLWGPNPYCQTCQSQSSNLQSEASIRSADGELSTTIIGTSAANTHSHNDDIEDDHSHTDDIEDDHTHDETPENSEEIDAEENEASLEDISSDDSSTDPDSEYQSSNESNKSNADETRFEELENKITIWFPYGSAEKLENPQVEKFLDNVVTRIKESGQNIKITGHTDNVDSDAWNMKLGLKRANAIRDYLVSKGVDSSKITTESMGERDPADTNKTKQGRANNRRVVLVIE